MFSSSKDTSRVCREGIRPDVLKPGDEHTCVTLNMYTNGFMTRKHGGGSIAGSGALYIIARGRVDRVFSPERCDNLQRVAFPWTVRSLCIYSLHLVQIEEMSCVVRALFSVLRRHFLYWTRTS